jgi:uncharacterized protein YqeY
MGKKQDIKDLVKQAMRAKEKVALATLRGLLSAIQYEEMKLSVDEISDQAIVAVVQSEIKKRKETQEILADKNKPDEIATLEQELSVLSALLPSQLSKAELQLRIQEIVATISQTGTAPANMGAIMKVLQRDLAGQYDPKLASEIARTILT